MLISGFTFIRNARKYDFPILECIESLLPVVDELVINVGKSDDGTEELIASISSPKIKIVHSVWDDSKTDRGLVLSEQTNIALDACQGKWALYLQADEALNEKEHALIRKAVEDDDGETDGFRFRYLHFYGGYTLVQRPWNWYPSEIRLIRRDSGARSYGDAQTFRKANDAELITELLDAHVFHYGHARAPEKMAQKINYFHRFWHGDQHGIETKHAYQLELKNLVWYWGKHPKAYESRVSSGRFWSPRPSKVITGNFKRLVILHSKAEEDLATELRELVAGYRGSDFKIEMITSYRQWFKCMSRSLFIKDSARQSQLVDLRAEDRGLIEFLGWILDPLVFFRTRIAHAPYGRLSKFKGWFYTAINWGTHETSELGFEVPRKEDAKQLARWLGIDV